MVRNHCCTQPAPCVRPRCVCSVLRAHAQFAGLIRRTPPPTFSDTATTHRHSDTTIFQLRSHWVRISQCIGSEKSFGHVPPVGVEPSTSCVQGQALRYLVLILYYTSFMMTRLLYRCFFERVYTLYLCYPYHTE